MATDYWLIEISKNAEFTLGSARKMLLGFSFLKSLTFYFQLDVFTR
jgi:hypothetical protein